VDGVEAAGGLEALGAERTAVGGDAVPFPVVPVTARRIVFVCCFSDRAADEFGPVRADLLRVVRGLGPGQLFNVVFSKGRLTDAPAADRQMIRGDSRGKRKAADFAERFTPSGGSDPLPALRKAFGFKPDVVYLATDGQFWNGDMVVQAVNKMNAAKAVKLHVVWVRLGREHNERTFLRALAQAGGGEFRVAAKGEPAGAAPWNGGVLPAPAAPSASTQPRAGDGRPITPATRPAGP
jgi:hypothetical protein